MRGRGCAGGLISERALERAGHCVHGAREGSDTDLQPPLNRGAYGSVATETRHGEGGGWERKGAHDTGVVAPARKHAAETERKRGRSKGSAPP